MKFDELREGRLYSDKNGNIYMFDGYQSSSMAEMVVMEYDKKDDCYYSTDMAIYMDKFDVLELV